MEMIRYAQCWEDAEVLLEGLDVQPGDTCLSIASAGDNTLALLCRAPARVIAIDYRPEQIACLELRVSAYRHLTHGEMLELIGSRPSARRAELYQRCRPGLSQYAKEFWDARARSIAQGIGHAGKFERYLRLFRRYVLPLVHSRGRIANLLQQRDRDERRRFFELRWNNWRWRLVHRVFFSRWVMAKLGREPAYFAYAAGNIAAELLQRSTTALVKLDPGENPYLQWIFSGRHGAALPFALRQENFACIRANLPCLEWHCGTLEKVLEQLEPASVDRFNLSDIFEYLAPVQCERLMQQLLNTARTGGRMLYWNLFVKRTRPEFLAAKIRPLSALARRLHRRSKTFFYGGLVIEEFASAD